MSILKRPVEIETYIKDLQNKIKRLKNCDSVNFFAAENENPLVCFNCYQSPLQNQVYKHLQDAALTVLYKEVETYQNRLKELQT